MLHSFTLRQQLQAARQGQNSHLLLLSLLRCMVIADYRNGIELDISRVSGYEP